MDLIRSRFYTNEQKCFFRDQRFLLYAITWPASWFHERGLHPPPNRYKQIIVERLDDIRQHGIPAHYTPYFPRYLLKVLQDHFKWHGDQLYQEFKHIRNALYSLNSLLQQLQNQQPTTDPSTALRTDNHTIEALANTHHILATRYQRKTAKKSPKQLSLF